jgi:hypothetical protein
VIEPKEAVVVVVDSDSDSSRSRVVEESSAKSSEGELHVEA